MSEKNSRIPGFYKLNAYERLSKLMEFADLTDEELKIMESMAGIDIDVLHLKWHHERGTWAKRGHASQHS